MKCLFTKKLLTPLLITCFILSLFAAPSVAQVPDIYGRLGLPTDKIPFMKNVRMGTLPNGMRYYILKNDLPKDRAYITLVVNAGSVLEEDNERGIAHFVEHMLFQGTKRFPNKRDIIEYFRSIGMKFGADDNASTSFNETIYGLDAPVEADSKGIKHIPQKALSIIDDWSYAATFDSKNIDSERLVILEEKRLAMQNAYGRVVEKLLATVYKGSKYASRLPIGLSEIIENAPQSVIKGFYKKWYRPDNMAVILVGDFDDVALEKKLSTCFHAVPSVTPLQRPNYEYPLPKKGNLNVEVITDSELTCACVDIIYNQLKKDLGNSLSSLRQDFIVMLISNMILRRFEYETSKPSTPYVHACIYEDSLKVSSPSRFLYISAVAKTNKTEKVIKALLKEKERVCRYGWTQSEVDIAKREILANLSSSALEKKKHSSGYASKFIGHFTGRWHSVADNDWLLEAANKMFPHIDIKELNDAVKEYCEDDDDAMIVITASQKDKIPSQDKIKKIIQTSKGKKIAKPVEESINDVLLDKAPTPGKILSEVIDGKTKSVVWMLSNGVKVVLQKTDNKTNNIEMEALAKGGILDVLEKQIPSARCASSMLNCSGVWKYSQNDLSKKLSGKQVGLYFNMGMFTHSFCGGSVNQDLKTLFELVYLNFVKPRFDSNAIKSYITDLKTFHKNKDNDPQSVFWKDFSKIICGNDPYYKPFEFADIPKINKVDAFKFIKKALNPADYTFVFVGSIDSDALREYVETYIASIPAGKVRSVLPKYHINRPGEFKHEDYKGKDDSGSAHVNMEWIVNSQYSPKEMAIAEILGEYLDIVLLDRIRMKLSKTYDVSCYVDSDILLEELSLGINFSCNPKDVDGIISEIMKDINAVSLGSINRDVLNKAKKTCKNHYDKNIQNNCTIACKYADLDVIYNEPFSSLYEYPKLYDSVNTKDLQIMVEKLMKGGCTRGVLYPEQLKK